MFVKSDVGTNQNKPSEFNSKPIEIWFIIQLLTWFDIPNERDQQNWRKQTNKSNRVRITWSWQPFKCDTEGHAMKGRTKKNVFFFMLINHTNEEWPTKWTQMINERGQQKKSAMLPLFNTRVGCACAGISVRGKCCTPAGTGLRVQGVHCIHCAHWVQTSEIHVIDERRVGTQVEIHVQRRSKRAGKHLCCVHVQQIKTSHDCSIFFDTFWLSQYSCNANQTWFFYVW